MGLVAEGRLNKEIAEALGISEQTVKNHLDDVFRLTGVRTRVEAALASGHLVTRAAHEAGVAAARADERRRVIAMDAGAGL